MYILFGNHFNPTAELFITQLLSLLVLSEVLLPQHTSVILGIIFFSLFLVNLLTLII